MHMLLVKFIYRSHEKYIDFIIPSPTADKKADCEAMDQLHRNFPRSRPLQPSKGYPCIIDKRIVITRFLYNAIRIRLITY